MESQNVCGALHTVGVCGTHYGEMRLWWRCVYTCTPHQAHHTLLPVAIFPQARSFVCSFFPFSRNARFQLFARISFLLSQATISPLPVEPVATAVAEPHVSSVPVVTYAAPVPVIRCVTPVQMVNTLLQLCGFAAPAPVLEDVALAPVKKYVAPVPAVTCVTSTQQFLAAYTMAAVMTGVNLDVTCLVDSTVLHFGC